MTPGTASASASQDGIDKRPEVPRKPRKRRPWRRLAWATFVASIAITLVTVYLYLTADTSLRSDLSERTVSEVTQLHRIQVGRVVRPRSIEEIAQHLRTSRGAVSIGGARCSMGGQVAEPGSLHFDMRSFNRVLALDVKQRRVTVQAGITWRDLQDRIDSHGLSVKIMQTYSNFTVGGSLSVNAHGRYMGRGPIVQSVAAIRLVLADGSVVDASPSQNAELFYGAIGGYGGLGVIAEATLELAPNVKVARQTQVLDTSEYVAYFREHIRDDPKVVFHNADLHPPDFDTARAVSWLESDAELTEPERLIPRDQSYYWTPRLVNGTPSLWGGFGLRQYLLEPLFFAPDVVTWRNHEASYDIAELEPEERAESTFVLREYFVPVERFDEFVPKLREVFQRHEVKVVNISVRHASPDPGTLLAWARGETFAFVVYYEQGTGTEDVAAVRRWSRELVDAVLSVGGTYYLPYQNHPTRAQFLKAYPRAGEYFALKRRVDPELRFQNSLLYAYGTSPRATRDYRLDKLHYERKPEGQTLFTIPEWYLVWNPAELVDHLKAGRAPDAFPFFESVREYLSLYRKVVSASAGVYPDNSEYLTMLRVIGASTAVEYIVKGSYEATVGWAFRALSSGKPSSEDAIIADAHAAYSKLIYDEAWYEFAFLPWVSRIWSETPVLGDDVLRRTERKLAFSAEFLTKAVYAELLGLASKTAYGPANDRVHVVLRTPEALVSQWPSDVERLGALGPREELVALERWKEFSETVPRLLDAGFELVEIAGNDDIAVSLIERGPPLKTPHAQPLLDSRVVSRNDLRRSVWLVPVPELGPFLADARAQGASLEHLYDY